MVANKDGGGHAVFDVHFHQERVFCRIGLRHEGAVGNQDIIVARQGIFPTFQASQGKLLPEVFLTLYPLLTPLMGTVQGIALDV